MISHHLLLCATPTKAKCCDPALGAASWEALKLGVRELALERPDRPEGVVLLIWPDGIWYGAVTPERIRRILEEHVIGGCPCEDWVIRRSPFSVTPQH